MVHVIIIISIPVYLTYSACMSISPSYQNALLLQTKINHFYNYNSSKLLSWMEVVS